MDFAGEYRFPTSPAGDPNSHVRGVRRRRGTRSGTAAGGVRDDGAAAAPTPTRRSTSARRRCSGGSSTCGAPRATTTPCSGQRACSPRAPASHPLGWIELSSTSSSVSRRANGWSAEEIDAFPDEVRQQVHDGRQPRAGAVPMAERRYLRASGRRGDRRGVRAVPGAEGPHRCRSREHRRRWCSSICPASPSSRRNAATGSRCDPPSRSERAHTVATEHGGRLVKLLGDGAMLRLPDAERGLSGRAQPRGRDERGGARPARTRACTPAP